LASEQTELEYLAERLQTPSGIRKLKKVLRNSFPAKYRVVS
jgi:hypothetical protein